jgi:hypothetical protein
MFETLAAGTTARTVTVADLNIPDPPEGADPQSAARPKHAAPPAPVVPTTPFSKLAALDVALASLDAGQNQAHGWSNPRAWQLKSPVAIARPPMSIVEPQTLEPLLQKQRQDRIAY